MRRGPRWLKTALVQAAWAAARKKDSYFRAQFHRLRARRVPFQDLGGEHYDRLDRDRTAKRLNRRLEDLGLTVRIRSAA